MRDTRNVLMTLFWGIISVALAIVTIYETGILDVGVFASGKEDEFVVMSVMELLTIATIPLSLRLFKFGKIAFCLKEKRELALLKWGIVRISMLGALLLLNTVLYYLYMSTTFGYMAIIVLLCMIFIYPSLDRCYYELSITDKKE